MDSSSDQTVYDLLFELLEPASSSPESGFQLCRRKLIKFFSWKRCPDPANLADETILRVLTNLKQGQMTLSEKPYSYVYAVALNVYRENVRDLGRHPSVPYEQDVGSTSTPQLDDGCHELCLKQLPAAKRELLNEYYLVSPDELAQKLELTANALRLRIHRIKQELRDCCQKCQKRSAS